MGGFIRFDSAEKRLVSKLKTDMLFAHGGGGDRIIAGLVAKIPPAKSAKAKVAAISDAVAPMAVCPCCVKGEDRKIPLEEFAQRMERWIREAEDDDFFDAAGGICYIIEQPKLCMFLAGASVKDICFDDIWGRDFKTSIPQHAFNVTCEKSDLFCSPLMLLSRSGKESESQKDEIAFSFFKDSSNSVLSMSIFRGDGEGGGSIAQVLNSALSNGSISPFEAKAMASVVAFSVNLKLYIDAFPDCVLEGPPKQGELARRVQTIRAVGRVAEIMRDSPEAHWRSGHFRVLRDERFKRAADGSIRTVYVNPCVVATAGEKTVVLPNGGEY